MKQNLFRCTILFGVLMTTLVSAQTPLHDAVKKNNLNGVKTYTTQEYLEVRDDQKNTPLMLATQNNNHQAAEILILAGADVNAKNAIEDTPYLLAGAQGYNEILKLTLEHGANIKDTNRYGGTAIIPAAEKGHPETVKLLLAAGADPDFVNRLGWTALLEVVLLGDGSKKYEEITDILLEGGANPNIPDSKGVTALQYAKQKGFKNIAASIEKHGGK